VTTTNPDTATVTTTDEHPACHACGVSLRQVILGQGHHHDPTEVDVVDTLSITDQHDLSILLSMATTDERIMMHQILVAVRGADAVDDQLWETADGLADGAMMPTALDEMLVMLINRPVHDWPQLRIRFTHQYTAANLGGQEPRDRFDDAVDLARHDVRINGVRAQLRANLNELVRLAGTCDTLLGRLTNELFDEDFAAWPAGADLEDELAQVARHARAAVRINREIVFPPST
jgi:hypothetical protein